MEIEISSGEITEQEYYRKDLKKAMRILLYSFISAAVVTLLVYLFL